MSKCYKCSEPGPITIFLVECFEKFPKRTFGWVRNPPKNLCFSKISHQKHVDPHHINIEPFIFEWALYEGASSPYSFIMNCYMLFNNVSKI
jgi:hypothetical protein